MFFVICPYICGGSFNELASTTEQARFIAIFQTGWFIESLWTQILILHLLRTKKIPFVQSKPSLSVILVTVLGILFFTVIVFTPVGRIIGLTSLPPMYFGFLIFTATMYLLLVSAAKNLYVKKHHELF
jgi:Mg2+-importing ATPase